MRGLTPEERVAIVAKVCRSALRVLSLNPKWEKVLATRDPVPQSTRQAWQRLRAT